MLLEKLKGAGMSSQYYQETKNKFSKNRFNISLPKPDVDNKNQDQNINSLTKAMSPKS